MDFGGARSILGSSEGLIVETPFGKVLPFLYHLYFDCTNNITEYKDLALGIRQVEDLGVKKLRSYQDSELIVNQVCNG